MPARTLHVAALLAAGYDRVERIQLQRDWRNAVETDDQPADGSVSQRPDDGIVEQIKREWIVPVRTWTDGEPHAARVWFFGNRAKPDSDLDIAVSVCGCASNYGLVWNDHRARWEADLANRLPDVKIHLWRTNKDFEAVRGAAESFGILIYAVKSER